MTLVSPHTLVRLALAWSILAGGPFAAVAQTQDPPSVDLMTLSLEDLLRVQVTTASRVPESVFDAPAIMVVLTENDLQTYGGDSLVDVLDRTTSVFFMGTQENLHGALTMRGDATLGSNNHVLVLVNGRPIQESTQGGMIHAFLRSFPLASIRQIEIIRGPGSVLYGTNAYVGVINIITKDWDAHGVAGVSYGAFDTKTGWAAGGKKIGDLQVSAGIGFSYDDGWDFTATDTFDGPKPAITRTVPWFDREVGTTLNAKYKGLNLDASYARTEVPHLTNSTATTSWTRYGVSNAAQAMVDLGYRHQFSTRWTSSLHGTYNHFRDNADYGEIGERQILSNNYIVEWANELSVTGELSAVFGANLSKRTGSFYETTFDWYAVPAYNRNNFTAFAQADYRPISRLKLIAGAQVIKIPGFNSHVTGGQSGEESRIEGTTPHFVGRLGGIFTIAEGLGVKLLYSEAFRQPSVVETDLVRYDEGDYTQEGNPDLRPEEIATTDLQVFYGRGRVNAAVTVFDSRQSNVITEIESFELIQNFDRFLTRGIELEARVQPLRSVELMSALTYQRLNNKTDRVFDTLAIPVPRLMAKIGVSYRMPSGLTVGLHDSYFGTPRESSRVDEEDAANTTKYVNPTASAFHNVTLKVAYRRTFPRSGRDLTPYLHVNNLLDEDIHYAEYTSVNVNSIPGRPGRAVFVGLNIGF